MERSLDGGRALVEALAVPEGRHGVAAVSGEGLGPLGIHVLEVHPLLQAERDDAPANLGGAGVGEAVVEDEGRRQG